MYTSHHTQQQDKLIFYMHIFAHSTEQTQTNVQKHGRSHILNQDDSDFPNPNNKAFINSSHKY